MQRPPTTAAVAFGLTSVCLHACMCVTTTCLPALHYNLSQSLPFSPSISLCHLSPLCFLSPVMLHRVHAQSTEPCTPLCIYHTCTCNPLGMASERETAIWFAFLSRGGRPALASLSTYEMKSDAGDACLRKLESLNRVQE